MTYYVSRVTGDVDVLWDAFAVDDIDNSLRFLTARGENSAVIADIPKATIVGVESAIADGSDVLVVDRESQHAGRRGVVVSLRTPGFVEVDLVDNFVRLFAIDQLGVWSENRRGRDGHPPNVEPPRADL